MNRWIDLIVVAVYLGAMAALGLRFSRRQTSTESLLRSQTFCSRAGQWACPCSPP